MIHRNIPDAKIRNNSFVVYRYPPVNDKIVREVSSVSKHSKAIVHSILDCWNQFVNISLQEHAKVKIPYIGSFQPKFAYRSEFEQKDNEREQKRQQKKLEDSFQFEGVPLRFGSLMARIDQQKIIDFIENDGIICDE